MHLGVINIELVYSALTGCGGGFDHGFELVYDGVEGTRMYPFYTNSAEDAAQWVTIINACTEYFVKTCLIVGASSSIGMS